MAFDYQRQDNAYFHIRINRKVSFALIVSVLVHALLLWGLSLQDLLNPQQPVEHLKQTMVVRLNPKPSTKTNTVPPTEAPKPPPVSPARKAREPESTYQPVAPIDTPKVMAVARAETAVAVPPPASPAQRAPAPPKVAMPDPAQYPDMMAYLAAVRERRRSTGEDAGMINEDAIHRERERSEESGRVARPQQQQSGTNGIFQILSMDAHAGRLAFRGWKNEFSYSHREVYEVYAGADGSVERALVRKMIEIIRRDYSGDFNWESPRFGRVIVLSARLQDNDGLEDFLLQEFFGLRGVPAG